MTNTKSLLLAAGFGTRLRPLTNIWPKCLMPIQDRPLLEYWLGIMRKLEITDVLVNTHYFSEYVHKFLEQPHFIGWVNSVYENKLLGTAGTVRKNIDFCRGSTILLAHADNWTCCNFSDFLNYHHNHRPEGTVMTMMTFNCPNPLECGIVELDHDGVVVDFHEKVKSPPSKLANAAVYLIEPEVIKWISDHPKVNDFSTEVLPSFLGKIATWNNQEVHRDIGTIKMLKEAQTDKCEGLVWNNNSSWQKNFLNNPIHKLINI